MLASSVPSHLEAVTGWFPASSFWSDIEAASACISTSYLEIPARCGLELSSSLCPLPFKVVLDFSAHVFCSVPHLQWSLAVYLPLLLFSCLLKVVPGCIPNPSVQA